MKIVAPKETANDENRVALTPQSAVQLIKLGHECYIQSGAGLASRFSDQDYKDAGAKVIKSAATLYKQADIIVKVRAPNLVEAKSFKKPNFD